MFNGPNTRQHFRIAYPSQEMPKFKVGIKGFRVVNLSERGGLFLKEGADKVTSGSTISGTIIFHDNETTAVEGEILKESEDRFVVFFTKGVPFSVILKEQRYLKEKYKHLI